MHVVPSEWRELSFRAQRGIWRGGVIAMPDLNTNVLYYGDNLDILRHHIPAESIDLIYLDPPFNSNRSYNVLFRESTGAGARPRSRRSRTPGTGDRPRRPRTKK